MQYMPVKFLIDDIIQINILWFQMRTWKTYSLVKETEKCLKCKIVINIYGNKLAEKVLILRTLRKTKISLEQQMKS